MDCYTDYTVKLITDTEHSSLYNWCLQEFNSDGEQIGRDLIPWGWSLEFDVTNLRYAYSLKHEDAGLYELDEDEKGAEKDCSPIDFRSTEGVSATLIPAEGRFGRIPYSMVGTDREIRDIHLRIEKAEADGCNVWGSVSHTFELDFRYETIDDLIDIHVRLTPDKFDELARMINSEANDGGMLRLSGVRGFYSDWSPGISTDFIKVLTPSINDHKVEIPEDADIDPPRLGTVQEFQFLLNNKPRLKSAGDAQSGTADFEWAEKQTEAVVRSVSENYSSDDDDTTPHTMNEERAKALRRTRKHQLLNETFRELSRHAANKGLGPDALDDLAYETRSFFNDLEYAFHEDSWSDYEDEPHALTEFYERTWQLWQHRQIRFDEIKQGKVPHIDRSSLTEAVAKYLDLPVRNRSIDRMLVDALIAAEEIAFADQMLNIPSFLKDLSTSPFVKSHPLWRFIKGQVANFVMIAAIPIGVIVGAVSLFDIRGDWPLFVGIGFAGLWALFFVIGLLALPSFWVSETRRKRKVGELLEAMHTVHTEIGTGAVVSARHIRERLDKTTDQGAVWPSEVFPLLDDIIERGGVM